MMQRAVIYPFTEKWIPIVEHWNRKRETPRIVSAVADGKRGAAGRDIGILHNHDNMGVTIQADWKTALAECDTLILAEKKEGKASAVRIIEETLQLGKNVICMQELAREEAENLEETAREKGLVFEYHGCDGAESYDVDIELSIPEAPVIMVGEMCEGLDGADVALAVNRLMQARGYDSIAVLEQGCSALRDVYSYPKALREREETESSKVYWVNSFIKDIETRRKPDVIVMQIPDAMMKYNDKLCNGFGIIPFMVSQAVRADYFIFCVPYRGIEEARIGEISSVMEKRFGFEIDCIHMSNAALEVEDSIKDKKAQYLRLPREMVETALAGYEKAPDSILMVDCLNGETQQKLGDHIIDRLTGYSAVETIM